VIEVEHHWVVLSTVDARMPEEVLVQTTFVLASDSGCSAADSIATVLRVLGVKALRNLDVAVPAVRLKPIALMAIAVKLMGGLQNFAAAASLEQGR
jgi:hypothetical protein